MVKVYVLTKEIEELAGVKEFKILAISKDENKLRNKIKEYKKMDEFGILEKNGIEYEDEVSLVSNYLESSSNCYLAYFVESHTME